MVDPTSWLGRGLRRVGSTRLARQFLGPRVVTRLDRVLHRLTRGRVIASDLLFQTLMLTTTGRRSGPPRTTPLHAWTSMGSRW